MVNEEEVRGNKKWKRNRFRTAFCMSIVPIRQMWPLLVWSIAPHKSVYKLSSTGGKYRCVKGTHIHKHTHKRTRQNENKPVEPWLKKVEISTHRARPSDMAFYMLLVILCVSFYLFIKFVPYHYSRVGHRRSVPGGDPHTRVMTPWRANPGPWNQGPERNVRNAPFRDGGVAPLLASTSRGSLWLRRHRAFSTRLREQDSAQGGKIKKIKQSTTANVATRESVSACRRSLSWKWGVLRSGGNNALECPWKLPSLSANCTGAFASIWTTLHEQIF